MKILLNTPTNRHEVELVPDSVLPCQLNDRQFGGAALQPEKRLQLAVLQDAVLVFHRCVGVEQRRAQRRLAEVDAWFGSDDTDGPFTFATICATLNLEPDYVRSGLKRLRDDVGATTKRKLLFRRNVGGTRHHVVPPRLRRSA